MKLSRNLTLFFVISVCFAALQIGCWRKNDKNPVAPLPDSTLTSSVAFKIVTPSSKTASFSASIRAVPVNQAFVTFQLKLANFGNSLTPFSLVKKQVPVVNSSATVSFESLPNTTVVGSLQIENGNIDGFSNFHGAADLNQGSNIVELAPVGSLMPQDVLANAVSEIVSSSTLLLKAPTTLATELAKIVSNLPLDSASVYDEVLNNFSNRTGLPLVELLAPANTQTFTIGSSINIIASATDLDGSISKIEFYQNSIKIGEKSSLPFSLEWQPSATGTYAVYAKAIDNNAAVGVTASISVIVVDSAPTYTVTYNGNGNTGGTVPTDNQTYQQNATVTVADNTGSLTKTGYTFAGWNTAADGSGTSYNPAATFNMGASNVTLYAKWSLVPTYTVTYNGNGNTGGTVPTDNQTYQQNATVTVADNTGSLTKTGYTFAGWNTAADGTGTNYNPDTNLTIASNNIELFARWRAVISSVSLGFNKPDIGCSTDVSPTTSSDCGFTVDRVDWNILPEDTWGIDDQPIVQISLTSNNEHLFPSNLSIGSIFVEGASISFNDGEGVLNLGEKLVFTATYPQLKEFYGGSGTELDPYQIATPGQLNNVRNYLGPDHSAKCFKIIDDINLNITPWNQTNGWLPIGNPEARFHAKIDGNSKTITGLYIYRTDQDYQGLFGYTQNAELKRINLENVSINGKNYVGGLVGKNYSGSISTCNISGSINGEAPVGGLVGENSEGFISGVTSAATVNGVGYATAGISGLNDGTIQTSSNSGNITGRYSAGIAGSNSGSIESCSNTGVISASNTSGDCGGIVCYNYGSVLSSNNSGAISGKGVSGYAGGLIGWNSKGSIGSCVNSASVTGEGSVGGVVGANGNLGSDICNVTDCNNSGNVTSFAAFGSGSNNAGGLIGKNFDGGYIEGCFNNGLVEGSYDTTGGIMGFNMGVASNSYNTADINGKNRVGGAIGFNAGTVTNCYSSGSVTGIYDSIQTTRDVGGFAGISQGLIKHCFANGQVTGNGCIGGLLGRNHTGTVEESYSTTTVDGSMYGTGEYTGGLLGFNYAGNILNSYSTGSVTGGYTVTGGLIGNSENGQVTNCYAIGLVNGLDTIGGLIGFIDGTTINDCYWDVQTTSQASSAGGIAKNTSEMKLATTFSSWSFTNVWRLSSNSYPFLQSNTQTPAPY